MEIAELVEKVKTARDSLAGADGILVQAQDARKVALLEYTEAVKEFDIAISVLRQEWLGGAKKGLNA